MTTYMHTQTIIGNARSIECWFSCYTPELMGGGCTGPCEKRELVLANVGSHVPLLCGMRDNRFEEEVRRAQVGCRPQRPTTFLAISQGLYA
jgi:hypothetical protein